MIEIRLKELAEARGLNKSQVQKRTGLDLGLIRRYWENNTESVNLRAIDALCELLGVETCDLMPRVRPD